MFASRELDSWSLSQAMGEIWKCTTDTFESELRPFNQLAVSARLDYTKRVYRFAKNLKEEERLLRDVKRTEALWRSGEDCVGSPFVAGNHGIYAKRKVERIECMEVVFFSQYY
jgi:hypothetical protein